MRRVFFVVVVLLGGFCVWARVFFFSFWGGGTRGETDSQLQTIHILTHHCTRKTSRRMQATAGRKGDVTFDMNSNISYPQTDTHRSSITITILTHPWGTVKQAGKGDKTSLPLPHHLSVSPLQCPFSLNACPK